MANANATKMEPEKLETAEQEQDGDRRPHAGFKVPEPYKVAHLGSNHSDDSESSSSSSSGQSTFRPLSPVPKFSRFRVSRVSPDEKDVTVANIVSIYGEREQEYLKMNNTVIINEPSEKPTSNGNSSKDSYKSALKSSNGKSISGGKLKKQVTIDENAFTESKKAEFLTPTADAPILEDALSSPAEPVNNEQSGQADLETAATDKPDAGAEPGVPEVEETEEKAIATSPDQRKMSQQSNPEQHESSDEETLKKIDKLIERLTTSGKTALNETEMKSLKKICKRSDRLIEHAYNELLTQLYKEHAEIRLSAFQICHELFLRSHHFRDFVLTQFEEFIQLVTAINVGTSLPAPKAAAKILYQTAVKNIHEWNQKFGKSYKKLTLGYNYLKTVKKVDFSASEPRTPSEQENREVRQRRLEEYRKLRVERLKKEIEEAVPDIESCIVELKNCIELLLPNQDFIPDWDVIMDKVDGAEHPSTSGLQPKDMTSLPEFDTSSESESGSDFEEVPEMSQDCLLRQHGYQDRNYVLEINLLPEIHEDDDNREVICNLADREKLLAGEYMPVIKNWLEILGKYGADESLLKRVISLKSTVIDARQKYQQISSRIVFSNPKQPSSDKNTAKKSSGLKVKSTPSRVLAADVSTSSTSSPFRAPDTAQTQNNSSMTERKEKLLKMAPYRRFDRDLQYWGREDEITATPMIKGSGQHRFMTSEEEEFIPKGAAAGLERTMTYVGQQQISNRQCRAPLNNGKLCPRKDRIKCPFHGKIVDRDACGKAVHARDRPSFNWGVEPGRRDEQTWQDPEVAREVEAATGLDLGSSRGNKRRGKDRKRKYPGLTDLKEAHNTTEHRIHKKIFNKKSLKRVNAALDKMDVRKYDKFGSQFIHTFNK